MAVREARTFIGKPIAHLVEHLAADQKPRGYAEAGDILKFFGSHKSDKVRLAIAASGASLLPSSRRPATGGRAVLSGTALLRSSTPQPLTNVPAMAHLEGLRSSSRQAAGAEHSYPATASPAMTGVDAHRRGLLNV